MSIKSIMMVFGVLSVAVASFFFGGFYNIGADDKHWPVTEGVISVVRDASIAKGAHHVVVPDGLEGADRIRRGAGNYEAMCAVCHLTPGKESGELFAGLYPQPPRFYMADAVDKQRAFWVIKHGIKMTGMPAWGNSNSDDDIWSLVAFLRAMPKMDGVQYRTLVAKSEGHTHGGAAVDTHGDEAMSDHHAGEEGQPVAGGEHHAKEGTSSLPLVKEEEPVVSDHYADGHAH